MMRNLLLSFKKTGLGLALLVVMLVSSLISFGQSDGDFRTTGTGAKNWSVVGTWQRYNGSTWVTATEYPGQNAGTGSVTITDNVQLTLNISPANEIASLIFANATVSATTLTFSSGAVLTVTGAVTLNNPGGNSGDQSVNVGTGTLNCGSISMANTDSNNEDLTLSIGTGTVNVSGNVIMNGASGENAITFSGSGKLNVGGNFTGTGTFTCSTSTVTYSGTSPTIFGTTYYNLTFSGSGITGNPTNNLAIQGNLSNTGSVTINFSSRSVTLSGTVSSSNIAGFTTTGAVSMTKTAGTVTFNGNVNGGALTINGSGGTLNLGAGFNHTFTGVVTLTAGTLNGGSSTLHVNATSTTTWGGNASVFTPGTGTVDFGGGAQTLSATGTKTFNNLTFSGSGVKTISTTTVNGILSMEGTATISVVPTYGTNAALQYNKPAAFTAGVEWPATFSGSGGVKIMNTGVITFGAAKVITNNLSIAAGSSVNLGTFTAHTTGSLMLGEIGQACGTWGSASSSAINKDNTYFATTTGFVTVGNQPTVYSVTGGGSYCAGGTGVAIGLSDSEIGVTYQLYRDVSSVVGSPVSGTGAAITFGNQTEEGTYTAVATRTSGGCTANMTGSVSVIINPFPSAAGSISGSSSVVQGQSSVSYSVGAITNANSYTWTYSGTGATINGTTNSVTITFASNATGGNLTVYGLNSCGNGTVSAAFPITVNSPTECAYSENTSSTIIFVPCINMANNPETVSSTFISHQYFLLNVIKGLSYQIYTCNTPSQKLKMAIYEEGNASGSVIASSTSNTGNTCNSNVNNVFLSFTSPISGQVRVLINSIADCSDASITGLTVNVNVNGGDNTQDDPNAAGTDSWIGHIYDGASFNNYLGYYSKTETFQESFGTGGTWPDNTNDDATCFYSINSNGTARASLKDVSFSARYLMNSSKHGLYRADMTGDDGDRLLVDGVQVYSDWSDHSPRTTSDVLFSLSGNSTLAFEYYENGGQNVCGFNNLVQVLANNLSTNTTQSICVGASGSEISGDMFGTLPSGISLSGTGYQWTYSTTPGGARTNISGATGATFTPNASNSPFSTPGTYYIYRNAILSSTNNILPNPYVATNESNAAIVNISSPTITPTVSIAASPGATICTGTSITYTATAVNTSDGAVNYDFKINGNSQQSTSSNTFTTSTLTNGNLVTCVITITGGTCLTSNTATSNTVTMTVNPSTGVPVFTAGATSVCQNDPDGTYTATAANSTELTYSVLPVAAGSINASTGVMNWSAPFSGTATITATATGLCGTTSSDRIVTVNPLPATGEIVGD